MSVGLLGNAAEILPELVRRGVRPDAVTDQTSAHDPLHGYLPAAGPSPSGRAGRRATPKESSGLPDRRWPTTSGRC